MRLTRKAKARQKLLRFHCPYCQANIGVTVAITKDGEVSIKKLQHYE